MRSIPKKPTRKQEAKTASNNRFTWKASRSFDSRSATNFGSGYRTPPNERERFKKGGVLDFKVVDSLLEIGHITRSTGWIDGAPNIGETKKPVARDSTCSGNQYKAIEIRFTKTTLPGRESSLFGADFIGILAL